MKLVRIVLFLLLSFSVARSQSRYDVASIPPDLKPRASAIVRNMQLNIVLKELDDVTYHFQKVVTILNSAGEDQAHISLWYDKTQEIKYVKGNIINESGKVVGKFTEKNFNDQSAVSDFSLFEDNRIKHYSPAVNIFPYTIEYEYEIKAKQSLIFPDWEINPSPGVAVEKASLFVATRQGLAIRYRQNNYPGGPITGTDKLGMKTWQWEVKNLRALKDEPLSPDPIYTRTSVQIAPEKFSYRGVTGSFTNWKDYGKWMYDKLLSGRSVIPPSVAEEIKHLTANITDEKEKARKIYVYVQKKMRYISVQIGIGGFQPVSAEETDRLSYGDCKALVNYTQGLLAVAGIRSYYTVVAAGDFKENPHPDFATMNFGNHVILCLPFKNDTTWLECTSKTLPFGFLGDFTDDRDVIACTENGGILLHTPVYTASESSQSREATLAINKNGDLAGSMLTIFSGTQYDNRESVIAIPYRDQLEKVPSIYPLNNLEIQSYVLTQDKGSKPKTKEKIEFIAHNYASVTEGRLYMQLNQLKPYAGGAIKEVSNRLNPLYINRGFTDTDKLTFQLPEGYQLEHYPENISLDEPFGKFSMTIERSEGKLIYTRRLQLTEGTYPAGQYKSLIDFYQAVKDADSNKLILKKP